MSVKLNIGLSRKVGEASFGSRGASINLEVELDNGVLNDPGQLRDRVQDLYLLARQSVDEELQRPADADATEPAHTNGNGQRRITHAANGSGHTTGGANGHATHGRATNGHSHHNGHSNGHGQRDGHGHNNGNGRIEVARATQSQIRAIFAISKRQGLDPHTVIHDRYRVHKMEELTIREASALIDELKNSSGARS